MSGKMTTNKYRKRFEKEFKQEIVRLVEELGKSPTSVAKDIGVTPQTVRRWIREFGQGSSDAFPGKGNLHPEDKEKRDMKRRIKDLEEENLILKKAMAIFSRDGK